MKIVINRCYGGFGLSDQAHSFIAKRKGWQHACDDYDRDYWLNKENQQVFDYEIDRADPDLIAVVEELGKLADGPHAYLKVVNIPDNIQYLIHEYDGLESIHENHRSWE